MKFPVILYHPTKAPKGKTFNSEEEIKVLGPKWVDSPNKLSKNLKVKNWLHAVFKPWWAEWEWLVKAIAAILGAIAAIIVFARIFLV